MTFDLWTLGFQAVNVLVLIWLLHRFFWKPVAATIAKRQAAAATLLEEAKAKRSEADAALADIAAIRAGQAAERDALLATARKTAEAARAAALAEAEAEAVDLQATASSARTRADEAQTARVMAEAQGLALTIAGRLVARLDGPATDAAFLGWLVQGLAALTAAERSQLAGADLEVVSSTDQDGPAKDRIAQAVITALGSLASLTFRTDPALIAGHELHSPHVSLRNSWRADLARIGEALGDQSEPSDGA